MQSVCFHAGKKKRAAPVLNSRIVQIEASFICSILEFSLRFFFFPRGRPVSFTDRINIDRITDGWFLIDIFFVFLKIWVGGVCVLWFCYIFVLA
jgi:hypothetical protein